MKREIVTQMKTRRIYSAENMRLTHDTSAEDVIIEFLAGGKLTLSSRAACVEMVDILQACLDEWPLLGVSTDTEQ